MPVIAATTTNNRKGIRGAILGFAVVFGLLVILPLAPFAAPIACRFGGKWVRVEAGTMPPTLRGSLTSSSGYWSYPRGPIGVSSFRSGSLLPEFTSTGDYHCWWLRAGDLLYTVESFQGHRGYP